MMCNSLKLNTKKYLKVQSERVPQKSNYECGQCDYTTTSKRYLQRHTLRWHTENLHPKIYYCDHCDFKTRWKKNIQKHIDGVHAKKTYYCDQCNFETKWEGNLKLHIDGTHANIKYCCDQCDYKTTWKMNLKKHVDSAHKRIYYYCEKCDFKTNWKTHLYRHMKVHDKILVDEQSSKYPGLFPKPWMLQEIDIDGELDGVSNSDVGNYGN